MKVESTKKPELRRGAQVATLEELANSGNINLGIALKAGDIIEFPDDHESLHLSKELVGRKKTNTVYQILVQINGKLRYMPIGTVRKQPIDAREQLKNYPVNLEILELGGDLERVPWLLGKTLKVTELVPLDFTIYDEATNTAKRNEDGTFVRNTIPSPIFEIVR